MLLFEEQEQVGNQNSLAVVIPTVDDVLIMSSQGSKLKVRCLIRISLDEIIDYYLSRDQLLTAQKLIVKYNLKSTKILEYKLKGCAYRDADAVKEFLDISFEALESGQLAH